jgi:hypothetical protein
MSGYSGMGYSEIGYILELAIPEFWLPKQSRWSGYPVWAKNDVQAIIALKNVL